MRTQASKCQGFLVGRGDLGSWTRDVLFDRDFFPAAGWLELSQIFSR